MSDLKGQCLCGAVTVTARASDPKLQACHCEMCRRHTSGAFVSLRADPGSVVFEGAAKSFRSSDWAERGFCEVCGSTLWYGTVADGARYPSAGLFADAGNATLAVEYFADNCPHGYAFAGPHKKLTTDETIALFTGEGE